MTESSETKRKLFIFLGGVVFLSGVVLSWPQSGTRSGEGNVGPTLAYFPPQTTVVAWGGSEVLKAHPALEVWPDASKAQAIHIRAFEKLGLPLSQVKSVAVGYSMNSAPPEMAMVLTGSFDAEALVQSALNGAKAKPATVAGKKGVSLSRGYVLVPLSAHEVMVGNVAFVKMGIEAPRKDWENELLQSAALLPDGLVKIAQTTTSFYLPGVTRAVAAVGVSQGLWLDMRIECNSAETCDRFPVWLDYHVKEITPGLTPNPEKTNAFLSTVNLEMNPNGSGRLTVGSPPDSE